MPHLPIIANVWRVTFNWSEHGGIAPRNVMHFLDATGGRTASQLVTNIEAAIDVDQFIPVQNSYNIQSFDCLKLDGTSSTVNITSAGNANETGGTSGDSVPNLAAVVKLATGLRGREHRGRVFLGPISEGAVDAGMLNSATADAVTEAWVDFTNTLITANWPLVVASYRHASASAVANVRCRYRAGSVRRRLDQIPLS
jgi:hypothetical protein